VREAAQRVEQQSSDRFDQLNAARFDAVAARTGLVERHYTIAGLGVTMRFAGDAMVDRLGPAIAHLESPTSAAGPALTLDVWDSASTGVEPPPMTGGEEFDTDETGPSYYYERDGIRAMNRWRTLSVLDLDAGAGWFWAPDAARIVSWDWAAPFRTIFHWWLGSRGAFQVHGGAVGLAEAGVIVVGRGGSGKSTTTLASVGAGLRYAGDDFVAITTGPTPYVHSLYSSGKVEPDHLQRFPTLRDAVANPERRSVDKAIVDVGDVFPDAPIRGFPLRAVLVPRVVARVPETRAVPLSAGAALAALAPSTIFQLYPPHPDALAGMAALVSAVPCFSLELGSDVERIPEAVIEVLEATP
jgi:hypothetical protein